MADELEKKKLSAFNISRIKLEICVDARYTLFRYKQIHNVIFEFHEVNRYYFIIE